MKCDTCRGTGVVLSCNTRRGSVCSDKTCAKCNGTGKVR